MNVGQILALILALLMVTGPQSVLAQQPQTQLPTTLQNGGGVTASGRRYDYKKVEDGKVTYFHVLRTREEIDAYLQRQGNVDPEMKRLADMDWTVMQHEWRRDPITSTPIVNMPPTVNQQDELFEAIDKRLNLSAEAKEEFKKKIEAGACKPSKLLEPSRFVIMANGTGVNEKLEVPPELAARTQSCEFFIESEAVVINLVFICGNFGYVFVEVWFETTPSEPGTPPVTRPGFATCGLWQNGDLITTDTPPFSLTPEQVLEFRGRAIGAAENLRLKAEWLVKGEVQSTNPDLDGREDVFAFGPKITNFAPGTYPGSFDLTDQFGRRSSCPFAVVVKRVEASPPPLPSKPVCPTCSKPNQTFRVGKDGIRLNISDFISPAQLKGRQIKSIRWGVNGNVTGSDNSLLVTTAELNKKKEVQFALDVTTDDGCVIHCEGLLKAAGSKWWIAIVVAIAAAGAIIAATHHGGGTTTTTQTEPAKPPGAPVTTCNPILAPGTPGACK